MEEKKILIIDDNIKICSLMKKYGESVEGYTIETVQTIDNAISRLGSEAYDLITLDIELEDESGLQRISDIKQVFTGPIIFVSCVSEIDSILEGLRRGADDYITKPFDLEELFLRIKRSINRIDSYQKLVVEDYVIDEVENKVTKNGRYLRLTPVALKILILLLKEQDEVLSREEIFARIWKKDYTYSTRVIDTHISHIRKETNDVRIRSVRSKGYTFDTSK